MHAWFNKFKKKKFNLLKAFQIKICLDLTNTATSSAGKIKVGWLLGDVTMPTPLSYSKYCIT